LEGKARWTSMSNNEIDQEKELTKQPT